MSDATPDSTSSAPPSRNVRTAWPFLLVFVSCLLFSGIRAPVPGVNEPHYLAKAKHFWNAKWCARDLFLESASPHAVFYVTFGPLTQVFNFATSAWIGRVVVLLLLAGGFCAFARIILSAPGAIVWCFWLFLCAQGTQSFSGEWIVGGVESKVVSYGFLFWTIVLSLQNRLLWSAACLGGAVSFHPVVGMWGALALSFAWASGWLFAPDRQSSPLRRYALPVVLFVLCALPGLIPALQLVGTTSTDVSPEMVQEAATVQVFFRLRHHLDPMSFRPFAYVWYGVLLVAWAGSCRFLSHNPQLRFFDRFVLGTFLAAAAGVLLGLRTGLPTEMPFTELRTALLKFYPFRLFDVMLPLAVSLHAIEFLTRRNSTGNSQSHLPQEGVVPISRVWVPWLVTGILFLLALVFPARSRNPSYMKTAERSDWREATAWIETHTPEDALFLTPINSWAFKWYAQRAEYVAYKDCPQDVRSLLEWRHRWDVLINWWKRAELLRGYSEVTLDRFRNETGVTHILERTEIPNRRKALFENASFRVLRVDVDD